ncbi:MAG TPA: 5'-nucleotidase C-terminal domain-containing protein [Rubrobacteraceae bacterium]|nr:5'-nucleotidase C-terminal domain-containing protein [Rubrobacteraceae bacterium]
MASLLLSFAVALMLAATMIWTAGAQSKPNPKPVPEDRIADVQLLGVNDFHGNLEPPRTLNGRAVGGAAYLDAYMDKYAAANPERTIRVHAGDMVGASPLISSYFHDEPTIYAANQMGFDVGTVGNHEFDEGGEEMLRLINGGQRDDGKQFKDGVDGEPVNTSDPDFPGADFPYIAANTVYKDTGKSVLPPYQVVKRDGVKVGFIGVTTLETPNIVVPDAVAPFDYLDISDTVNKYAKQLQDKGVQTIVVLAHSGGNQVSATEATGEILDETSQMSNAVDVVVAGHSHSLLNNRVGNKLVVEAFSFGTAFDAVDMKIDRKTGDVTSSSADIVTTYDDAIQPDAKTAELVADYKARIAPISERVVGTAQTDISRTSNVAGESAMGDLIADAQRDFAGADFAFMNPGGIRADIAAGEVTYGELFTVQPFDNQVVSMDLTGDQIYRLLEQQFPPNQVAGTKRILQVSGLKYTYDESLPEGQRITSLTKTDGTPIDRATTYKVAANSFIATGGDRFTVLKEGQNVQTIGGDLDALEAYIDSLQQPFSAPDPAGEQRITKAG